jgi:hypothetical protein
MEEKTAQNQQNQNKQREHLKQYSFKPGQSGNPNGRPKGRKNFETYFFEAWRQVAEELKMNKEPDQAKVEIIKLGFRRIIKHGDYKFWQDFINRLFGKPPENVDITSGGKPVVYLPSVLIEKYGINTSTDENSEGQDEI